MGVSAGLAALGAARGDLAATGSVSAKVVTALDADGKAQLADGLTMGPHPDAVKKPKDHPEQDEHAGDVGRCEGQRPRESPVAQGPSYRRGENHEDRDRNRCPRQDDPRPAPPGG